MNSDPTITVNDADGLDRVILEIGDGVESYNESVESGEAVFDEVDLGSSDYGTYNVIAHEDGDQDNSISREDVTFDGGNPEADFDFPGDEEAVDDDNPDIEASFEDSDSGLENASITFDDGDEEFTDSFDRSEDGDENSVDLQIDGNDYDSLSDGSHTVDYEAYDEAGNQLSSSWDFTVDTEYDGDSNPDFWVEDEDGDEIEDDYFDFGEEVELVADFGEADSESDITVTCMVGGEDVGDFPVTSDDPDESDTTCDIDYDDSKDYYDTNAEIYLEMEDDAGNSDESDTQELGFDARAPSISELESSSGVSVFNEDFEMSYEAFDSVSGVDYVDYSVGDGDESQLDEASGNFTVDTSDLEQGSYEVQAQAVDNVGKVSDERTFEFDFYPDEVPELTLEGETELNVTSGSEETLELNLENTGRLLVSEGEITGSEDFVESASYGNVAPGESETLDIVFSPENGLGEYTVDLQASSVDASHSVDVLVRADSSEQDEIDSQVQSYREDLDDLSSRVESLRPSLSPERSDRVDSDYEEFQSQVTEAEQAVEEGRYYEADEILGNLNTSRQSAESTFDTVRKEHETAMRNRYIIAGLFFVLLLIGGGTGFVLYSEDYEVDIDSLKDMDIGSSGGQSGKESDGYSHSETEGEEKSALDKIRDRVDNLRGAEEEEPEYEFK